MEHGPWQIHYSELNKKWEIEGVPAEERAQRLKTLMAQDLRQQYNRYDRERWENHDPYGIRPI